MKKLTLAYGALGAKGQPPREGTKVTSAVVIAFSNQTTPVGSEQEPLPAILFVGVFPYAEQ